MEPGAGARQPARVARRNQLLLQEERRPNYQGHADPLPPAMRPGHHRRLPNHVIGLILIALIAVGSFLAYTKKLPWSHGYEIKAVFTTAENVRVKSPVRIAGVNVGEVTAVEHCTIDNPACSGTPGDSSTHAATGNSSGSSSTGATG